MVKIDVEKYIDELRGFPAQGSADLYSLKEELNSLSESKIFESFEMEAAAIDRMVLEQITDFGALIRLRRIASEITNKKAINDKLHTMHFSLNLLKNSAEGSLKNAFAVFLYNDDTKISSMIDELNDFKSKLDSLEKHHSRLLPKGLDNMLEMEKRRKRITQLHSIRSRQKNALMSAVKLFLKMARAHVKTLKSFKNSKQKLKGIN